MKGTVEVVVILNREVDMDVEALAEVCGEFGFKEIKLSSSGRIVSIEILDTLPQVKVKQALWDFLSRELPDAEQQVCKVTFTETFVFEQEIKHEQAQRDCDGTVQGREGTS